MLASAGRLAAWRSGSQGWMGSSAGRPVARVGRRGPTATDRATRRGLSVRWHRLLRARSCVRRRAVTRSFTSRRLVARAGELGAQRCGLAMVAPARRARRRISAVGASPRRSVRWRWRSRAGHGSCCWRRRRSRRARGSGRHRGGWLGRWRGPRSRPVAPRRVAASASPRSERGARRTATAVACGCVAAVEAMEAVAAVATTGLVQLRGVATS
jgi:hypothetical protein